MADINLFPPLQVPKSKAQLRELQQRYQGTIQPPPTQQQTQPTNTRATNPRKYPCPTPDLEDIWDDMDETNQLHQIHCHNQKQQTKRYDTYFRATNTVLLKEHILEKTENIEDEFDSNKIPSQELLDGATRTHTKYRLNTKFLVKYGGCSHQLHPKFGSSLERKCKEQAQNNTKLHDPRFRDVMIDVEFRGGCIVCGKMLQVPNDYVMSTKKDEYDGLTPKRRAKTLCDNLCIPLYRLEHGYLYLEGYDAALHFLYNEKNLLNLEQYTSIVEGRKTPQQIVQEINSDNAKRGSRHVARVEDYYWP